MVRVRVSVVCMRAFSPWICGVYLRISDSVRICCVSLCVHVCLCVRANRASQCLELDERVHQASQDCVDEALKESRIVLWDGGVRNMKELITAASQK